VPPHSIQLCQYQQIKHPGIEGSYHRSTHIYTKNLFYIPKQHDHINTAGKDHWLIPGKYLGEY